MAKSDSMKKEINKFLYFYRFLATENCMFNDILNYILGLGAAIFLPIIMIILGLCVKMKLKKAIMACLT